MTKILFKGFDHLYLNGAFVPRAIREFELTSSSPILVYGYSNKARAAFGELDLKKKRAYGDISCVFGDTALVSVKEPKKEKRYLASVYAFSKDNRLYSAQEGGHPTLLVECDHGALTLPCERLERYAAFGEHLLLLADGVLYAIAFDSEYRVLLSTPCDSFTVEGNRAVLSYCPPTTESVKVTTELTAFGAELSATVKRSIERKGNYTSATLPVAFLERLAFADDKDVLELMTDDFELSDISALKEYVGDLSQILDAHFDGKTVYTATAALKPILTDDKISNVIKL